MKTGQRDVREKASRRIYRTLECVKFSLQDFQDPSISISIDIENFSAPAESISPSRSPTIVERLALNHMITSHRVGQIDRRSNLASLPRRTGSVSVSHSPVFLNVPETHARITDTPAYARACAAHLRAHARTLTRTRPQSISCS